MNEITTQISAVLTEYQQRTGKSRQQLADMFMVTRACIGHWLTGVRDCNQLQLWAVKKIIEEENT